VTGPGLVVDAVTVRFGGNVAVHDVSLAVTPGEILGLIGPNGAGKTTLLDAVSGFVPVDGAATVHLDGEALHGLLPYQRARRGLGRSFQDARLWPTLTVRETLLCGFHAETATTALHEGLGLRRVAREERRVAERAAELLALVDLDRYLDHLVSELSFGTTRAVELAWLAARRPRALLLDEPASGLQQSEVRVLGELVHAIRGDAAVVVIDHDVPFVSGLADRLAAMHLGELVALGDPDEVLAHPVVVESYLGSGAYAGGRR
jgi:ABC-type branched-subunit amino acid transport system ATPase component